jgi:hypothetical protein
MQTYQQAYHPSFENVIKKQSLVSRFLTWCAGQEEYRFGWLAVILAAHGCVLAPLTLITIFATGNNIVLICMVLGAMAMSLVSNLAAMPTKITIPIFFLSVVIDLVVVAISISVLVSGQF